MFKLFSAYLCALAPALVLSFVGTLHAQDTPINGLNVQAVKYFKANRVNGYFTELTDKSWTQVTPQSTFVDGTWAAATNTTLWTESGRDEWSVYLRSQSGDATVQIDLWTKKITQVQGGGTALLAEALEPSLSPISIADIAAQTQAVVQGVATVTPAPPPIEPEACPEGQTRLNDGSCALVAIATIVQNCPEGHSQGSNNGCHADVAFHNEAGLTLAAAQSIASRNGWKLATADQVQAAWQHLGFHQYAFGMLADGRFAVPVHTDYSNFKTGANIGAQGGNQGFFYVVSADAPVADAPVADAPPPPALTGDSDRQLNVAAPADTGPIYVGENDPRPISSMVCLPNVGPDPKDNWMLEMWPSDLSVTSDDLLVRSAAAMLKRRGVAVTNEAIAKVAADVKTDPVARYKFAPFMLGTFFDALVAEQPTSAQASYRGVFERYQGCADYHRANQTLREWYQYQGTDNTIGGVTSYEPALLSTINFNHSPSMSGFIESDPLAFGPRGGETVAKLYLPMAAQNGLMNENPMAASIGTLGDDMTAVAVGAGVGTGAGAAAVLMGGTAAYVSAAAAAFLAVPINSATASLAAAQATLASAQGAAAVAEAKIAVLGAEKLLASAQASTVSWGPTLANFAGPAIVVVMAAAILGSTVAEVAQKAAFEEKLRKAADNPYFSVAEFLNVPAHEQETRRSALFTLMVKHLIANPAESGALTLELPEYPCPPGHARGADRACVLEVKFHSQAGLTVDQAQELSLKNGWRIATAFEVQTAWEKIGLEAYAFGRVADGRFAVPVQRDMGNFKRGANIGAEGGNQGFFYTPRVEYRMWGDLTLKQAEDITGNEGDRLATAAEVQTAWQKQGLDVFAYGRIDDGRFAVPIQSSQGNLQRGVNIGAQGGNQGFFFVRNAAQTPGDLYYRGQQTLECSRGTQMEDGLCYKPCDAGYNGVATRCYAGCPTGFRDDGLYCAKPAPYEREGFGWRAGDPLLPNYSGPIGRCEAKYGGADIKFHSQAGLSLPQATQIATSNGWQLATADQVQKAWQNGLDVYAFGMVLDGRFAVPVQSDHSNFRRGANIGAQGGNQGFFYSLPACEQAGAVIYPKCKDNYHAATVNLCSPDCPSGMTDIGVSCQKNFYDRGVGLAIDTCPAGTEKVGALCYPLCRQGFVGKLDWCYKE